MAIVRKEEIAKMGWYRIGAPGMDTVALICRGNKSVKQCQAPRFDEDDSKHGPNCGRMSVALCDGPKCDLPICDMHRTRHQVKYDTDYCPSHKGLASV